MPAEILREAGFQTVGLWRNGWVSPTFGFDQGFDVYQRPHRDAAAAERPAREPDAERQGHRPEPDRRRRGVPARQRQAALVPLSAPDGPPRVHLRRGVRALRLHPFGPLRQLDPLDRRLDRAPARSPRRAGPAREHAHRDRRRTTARPSSSGASRGTRARSIGRRRRFRSCSRFPFASSPASSSKTRTQNVDVWPTILDLLGLAPPEGIDGRSRVPEILASASGQTPDDAGADSRSPISTRTGRSATASPCPRSRSWRTAFRYVRMERAARHARIEQLFDASDDPRELRDRAADDPETLERLRAAADDYYETKPSWGEAPTREIDELELNLLRALGYKVP